MRPVSIATPQLRTLRLALQDCGGEAALANVLGVSVEVLSSWLRGQEALPATIYLRALDLVAAGR
jgi:DNA-binding transcriptional regulator YdaS (Cro superfamily)